ncbi:MAG TPA: phage scaffolding protein [Mycobacteriales bacterium]|nr:phage scaffolding protein [Mycobacteriales bacterium]
MLRTSTPWFRLNRHDDTTDGNTAVTGADTTATGAAGGSTDTTSTDTSTTEKLPKSQAELDKLIQDRLARQKAQFADYDDLKTKASEFDKLQDAQKTELEREREARTAAEQAAADALARAQRTALASAVVAEAAKAGAVDPDAVLALLPADAVTVADDGTVTGAADAIKALLEAKPYLKGTARPSGDIDQGSRTDAPADFRKADSATLSAELAKLGLRPRR